MSALACAPIVASALACVLGHGDVFGELGAVSAVLLLPGIGWWLLRRSAGRPCGPVEPLLASLAWSTIVACVGAWMTMTQPIVLFAMICAPAVLGVVIALRGPVERRPRRARLPVVQRVRVWAGTLTTLELAAIVLGAGAVGAIVIAVAGARHARIGAWGLTPALGVGFVVAVLATVLLIALSLIGERPRRRVAMAGLVLLAFEFAGVPSLLTNNFLGGWDYKHLGVVDVIAVGHALSAAKDIYQQWPGFFAVAADVERLSGNASLHYANWATPLFLGTVTFAMYCAALKLYPGREDIAITTSVIVLVSAWAGQFYFAPQSMAMAIAMLILAGSVDRLPTTWRRRATAPEGARGPAAAQPIDRGWSGLQGLAFVAIVLTHQLTPFILLAQLTPFLFARSITRASRLAFLAAGAFTVGYLLAHLPAVASQSVFNSFSFSTVTGSTITAPSLVQRRAATGAHLVAFLVGGGAFYCGLRLRLKHRFQPLVIPAVLAVMPGTILLVGNYGGEAIYRVWLFSSPWCALIIAHSCCDLVRFRRSARILTMLVCGGLFFLSAQATDFGMWKLVDVPNADVRASTWILRHARPGSEIVDALTNFPGRITWRYTLHNDPTTANDPALTNDPQFERNGLVTVTAEQLAADMRPEFGPHAYLVISRAMEAEAQYYGTVTPTALAVLSDHLRRSRFWKVVYRTRQVIIFQPIRQ